MAAGNPEDSTLRAKYLDWCSARIADHFIGLSPEEIYRLAREREVVGGAGGVVESVEVSDLSKLSYPALVERVTRVLRARLNLPDFETWATAYREAPERFESELLGFWRAGVEDPTES